MNYVATFSITLDIRRVKQSGKFPVKLRVTFQRNLSLIQRYLISQKTIGKSYRLQE